MVRFVFRRQNSERSTTKRYDLYFGAKIPKSYDYSTRYDYLASAGIVRGTMEPPSSILGTRGSFSAYCVAIINIFAHGIGERTVLERTRTVLERAPGVHADGHPRANKCHPKMCVVLLGTRTCILTARFAGEFSVWFASAMRGTWPRSYSGGLMRCQSVHLVGIHIS